MRWLILILVKLRPRKSWRLILFIGYSVCNYYARIVNAYRQYSVLVDDEYAECTDTNRLSVQTIQKHVYLQRKYYINCESKFTLI